MRLDDELRAVLKQEADMQVTRGPDVDRLIMGGRVRRRRRNLTRVGGAVLAIVLVCGGVYAVTREPGDPGSTGIANQSSSTSEPISESPSATPLRTGSWQDYTSGRYDLTVGHPPNWTVEPADRDWTWESDVRDFLSPAHEAFLSPNGHVRVSVWNAPLDASTRQESLPYLLEWVEAYCEESGNSPCTGIADRAVELCLERLDCHPGLLVPFENDLQAFFSGGLYAQDAMTVVAVWRGESSRFVAPYGGSQRLLEAFLSTMEVWPSSTPRNQRR